jgi:hypothetical protein
MGALPQSQIKKLQITLWLVLGSGWAKRCLHIKGPKRTLTISLMSLSINHLVRPHTPITWSPA